MAHEPDGLDTCVECGDWWPCREALLQAVIEHKNAHLRIDKYDDKVLAGLDRGGADIELWSVLDAT